MGKINILKNMRMNKKKSLYEAPTTDVLVVRFEGAILTGSDPNRVRSNSSSSGYDSENYLDEL
jgi:hypothetical protein